MSQATPPGDALAGSAIIGWVAAIHAMPSADIFGRPPQLAGAFERHGRNRHERRIGRPFDA